MHSCTTLRAHDRERVFPFLGTKFPIRKELQRKRGREGLYKRIEAFGGASAVNGDSAEGSSLVCLRGTQAHNLSSAGDDDNASSVT